MFHNNCPIIRKRARHRDLPFQIPRRQHGCGLVQPERPQRVFQSAAFRRLLQSAQNAPEGDARFFSPSFQLSLPEWQTRSLHGSLRHRHRIPSDLRYLPAKRTENKPVALLRFIDKLLVRFSYFNALFRPDRVKPFVRNGASRGQCEHPAVSVSLHPFMNPVIQNPRSCGDVSFMLIVSRQHFQHGLHIVSCHIAERPCSRQNPHDLVDRIAFKRRHGHKMLREHVQAAFRRIHLFHAAFPCERRSHAAQNAFRRRPRKHVHNACSERIMSRPAKPLHRAGHRAGTAHLQYLVDLSHVNTELHRGRRAQKPQFSFPQKLLRLLALLFGKAPVMDAGIILSP